MDVVTYNLAVESETTKDCAVATADYLKKCGKDCSWAPSWAYELVNQVKSDEACNKQVPILVWNLTKHQYSSGYYRCFPQPLVLIRAGSESEHAKMVLLHELGHWLRPNDECHSNAFWDDVWRLYIRYGVNILEALRDEGRYRIKSIKAARRAGITDLPHIEAEFRQYNKTMSLYRQQRRRNRWLADL